MMRPGTREALISAAAQLLHEGGIGAVTLREVGHRAGVSHNAPYKHFASKEELLAAVAARDLTGQNEALIAAMRDSPTPDAALRKAMHDYVGWALGAPAHFKLVFGAWQVHSLELAAAADAAQDTLTSLVRAGQDTGVLPVGDAVRLAALLRALAHGAADLAAAGHLSAAGKGHAAPEELVDDLLAYLRVAARNPEAASCTP
jgi:AcrR family transcriptional regulator